MVGSVWTVVVAGGGGTRFGSAKQFAMLAGMSVIDRSVATAVAASDGVVVVLPRESDWSPPAGVLTVAGGTSRSESTRHGVAALPDDVDIIVVHDAARPLCPLSLYDEVIAVVRSGADGGVPALSMSDTIKRVDGRTVVETVPRDNLVTVQTPQAFRASALRAACALQRDDTDDAALIEINGGRVLTVDGDVRNIKITVPDDLTIASALLETM